MTGKELKSILSYKQRLCRRLEDVGNLLRSSDLFKDSNKAFVLYVAGELDRVRRKCDDEVLDLINELEGSDASILRKIEPKDNIIEKSKRENGNAKSTTFEELNETWMAVDSSLPNPNSVVKVITVDNRVFIDFVKEPFDCEQPFNHGAICGWRYMTSEELVDFLNKIISMEV